MRETYEQAIAEAEQSLFRLVEECDRAQKAYWEAYDRKVEARRRVMDLRKQQAETGDAVHTS
jgi:hypothetical protein